MTMELRQIRQFIAVAEALNFRRAAEQIGIAQPALSRGIQLLEHRLGVKLLLRSNRRVELTEAGRIFLTGCHGLMDDLEETVRRTRKAQDGGLGSLTIGYTDFAMSGALPFLLDRFRQKLPEVGLDLIYGATYQQLEYLVSGKIDVGFLTGPVVGDQFASLPVQRDRFVAVLPERHPLAKGVAVEIRSLANEPFIFGVMARWRHFRRH
ncbi:MAG: LysR family transcriptional regulator, partial [Betaproteobacteria bacterium HGW-Betaproteobacteria-21]